MQYTLTHEEYSTLFNKSNCDYDLLVIILYMINSDELLTNDSKIKVISNLLHDISLTNNDLDPGNLGDLTSVLTKWIDRKAGETSIF